MDYSDTKYINARTDVQIKCMIHNMDFIIKPQLHLKGVGCRSCCRFMTFEKFLLEARAKHRDKFLYEFSGGKFTRDSKINIKCKDHGWFEQGPTIHLKSSTGCGKCSTIKINNKTLKERKEAFISKAKKIHGDKFDYSKVEYKNNIKKIEISCEYHGSFFVMPVSHLKQSSRCPKCYLGLITLDTDDFIIRSTETHGDRYDYSKSVYKNSKEYIEIICQKHGSFFQRAGQHIYGQGCPDCKPYHSGKEDEWIGSLNNPNIVRNHYIKYGNERIHPDGFDPITNTVYEFNGSYWHGDNRVFNHCDTNTCVGKTFGELYSKTIDRENKIKELGYNLVVMWEEDYKQGTNANILS
jgi:hypothetical protein